MAPRDVCIQIPVSLNLLLYMQKGIKMAGGIKFAEKLTLK